MWVCCRCRTLQQAPDPSPQYFSQMCRMGINVEINEKKDQNDFLSLVLSKVNHTLFHFLYAI